MKGDFTRLKRKLFLQAVGVVLGGLALALAIQYLLIDGVWQAPFAKWFLDTAWKLGFDYDQSMYLYNTLLRQQKALLLAIGLIVLLIAIFYFTLSRLTRYFDEVAGGIKTLADFREGAYSGVQGDEADTIHEEPGHRIKLSREMASLEDQLNSVDRELASREQQRDEAEARKSELVVYLAHDIRTPLTSVIGYLALMQENPEMDATERAEYTGITLESALRLEELTNELFEVTQFNADSSPFEFAPIQLSVMLEQLADEFTAVAQTRKRSVIAVDIEPGLIVEGDSNKLARVFQNLIKNAIAFCFDETEITLSAHKVGERVFATVTNRGPMIDPEQLERVFEKFYRGDKARSSTGGAGLGLAIAREIARAHHGDISVESDAAVTSFTVTLPAS